MERKTQLWYLIGLTAATMMPQYALQGWLATGGNPADIAPWFLFADSGAWALRAIIEAWALVFLFSTQPNDDSQRRLLAFFEVALIVLIAATLGPALASVGLGDGMRDSLPRPVYWIWNFAVASYAPLMLGAAGFAFKVESEQYDDLVLVAANKTVERLNAALLDSEQRLAASEQDREITEQKANDVETSLTAAQARLAALETELRKALKPLNGAGAKVFKLLSDDKQERIRIAHELWPELPQRSLATIADASAAYVNKTIGSNGNGVHHDPKEL